MNRFKKISFLTAFSLIFGMSMNSATVMAEDFAEGMAGNPDGLTSVIFTSEITNDDNYTPATQYQYSISETSAENASLPDAVNTGISGGAEIESDVVSWSANDPQPKKQITVILHPEKFSQPGVYRYYITQSANTSEQTEIGLVPDADAEKALDIYAVWKNKSDHTEGILIRYAMLSDEEESVSVSDMNYTHSVKTDGFINQYGMEDADKDGKGDNYIFTLTKKVAGNMADTSQKFDFELSLSYQNVSNADDTSTTLDGMCFEMTGASSGTAVVGGSAMSFTLADGESVSLTLPKSITVNAKEAYANSEGYQITSSVTNMDAVETAPEITSAVTSDTNGTSGRMQTADGAICYLNTLDVISPTGILLETAPYLILFSSGAGLFLFSIKHRKQKES
ncbi:MAG: hypothetical protein IJJ69_13710 [Oscillospiraceae bacterium]|nr:hypothetical protein [Oscillospiraceae bacterium]